MAKNDAIRRRLEQLQSQRQRSNTRQELQGRSRNLGQMPNRTPDQAGPYRPQNR